MAVATSSTLSALTSYIQRKGLSVAEPKLIYATYGQKVTIPQKNSKTIKFRRYERFAPTTGAQLANIRLLVEGTTPTAITPSITDVTVNLSQYGSLAQYTDIASWINEVDVDQNLMARNSENMQHTVDLVYRDALMSGTNVFRLTDGAGGVSGAARANVIGSINAPALDKAIRKLKQQDAKFFKEMVGASNKIGTSSVRPSYVALIHPNVEYDLESVPGYKSISDYGDTSGLMPGEVGSYKNIRFVTSTLAAVFPDVGAAVSGTGKGSTTGTSADVYACLIVGQEAYAVVDLASAAEICYVPASAKDHNNPLGLWASLGWKAMCGAGILNDNWILRFECAANA